MNTPRFAAQYLESPPAGAGPAEVRRHLAEAFARLPIDALLLGWDLPPKLEETVAGECTRAGTKLYRWQPLLTGDSQTEFPPEWAVIGLDRFPVPGHGGLPEFTFACPNRPAVADFLAERVETVAARGLFQGIFLDRIRFPSPAADPAHLGCFCPYCVRLAADRGLDLESARRALEASLTRADGPERLARGLFAPGVDPDLDALLDFRRERVSRMVQSASQQAAGLGLAIGLDCFTPSLTRMVGQDLAALDGTCRWIKIMSYPRVYGPAGISFELHGLASWLIARGADEARALRVVAEASGLKIPETLSGLRQTGLGSGALASEIARGRTAGVTNLLAGLALVEMEGVHESTPKQIRADVEASRSADGLVLSWDLWLTPPAYLDTIRSIWC